MQIAVTGGSGRLGTYVVDALAQQSVRVLDLTPPADRRIEYRQADVLDLDTLLAALEGVEVVMHLGAIDRSVAVDDAATMQVNALGTWNLFEAARRAGVRRVVHASSSSVTGLDASNPTMAPLYLPVDETHPSRPSDAYGISKTCAETIAAAYARRGMQVIVLRPCFVAFPDLLGFMAGETAPEGRDEPQPLLSAYVGPEDCARAFAAAAVCDYGGFETLFLAADDSFAQEPTVPRLEARYNTTIPVREPSLFTSFPRASPISNAQAKARLGWQPTSTWSGSGLVRRG